MAKEPVVIRDTETNFSKKDMIRERELYWTKLKLKQSQTGMLSMPYILLHRPCTNTFKKDIVKPDIYTDKLPQNCLSFSAKFLSFSVEPLFSNTLSHYNRRNVFKPVQFIPVQKLN